MKLSKRFGGSFFGAHPKKSDAQVEDTPPLIVSFTGGIGAQILSLAIVLDLRMQGRTFGVDLSYFDQEPFVADPGGGVSIWPWGLDFLGYSSTNVLDFAPLASSEGELLPDSLRKLRLGVSALSNPCVRGRFPGRLQADSFRALGVKRLPLEAPYVAFHLRRGDYLNVASHIVPESDYIQLSARLSSTLAGAVVVSDSKISSEFRDILEERFENIEVLDGLEHNPGEVHHLLRNASIHVGSNGQFSLTAGLLSDALYLAPKRFVSGDDRMNEFLSGLSMFSAVTSES